MPGLVPGAEIVPAGDEFKTAVQAQAPAISTPASILEDLGQQWRDTGADAEAAQAEGTGGMDTVTRSWDDPALDEVRRRTAPLLGETTAVRDSARAMDEQVRRAGEQARAASEEMERNIERQAPGYYLATMTLPPGEREVAARSIIDITAAENRDIAGQAADNITNDPGWQRVETPPVSEGPTPQVLAQADILANSTAGVGGWKAAQYLEGRADFWSRVAELSSEYAADNPGNAAHRLNEIRGATDARWYSHLGKVADNVGKFGGPALGAPLAYLGYKNDIESGESFEQAAWSNGTGWAAGALTGIAIGTTVGGPVGAILGALGGAAVGSLTSGAVDSYFETGTFSPADDDLPQA
ncbi:hypothetical protein [Saccharomonospora cyanea]|uniref:hypothetical protein n=1 Tax=Saccharomonospora cyanea TaxID=40989 RepID=UPI00031C16C8|nr:hypothetical protein [Saccharomonospora cyanea]